MSCIRLASVFLNRIKSYKHNCKSSEPGLFHSSAVQQDFRTQWEILQLCENVCWSDDVQAECMLRLVHPWLKPNFYLTSVSRMSWSPSSFSLQWSLQNFPGFAMRLSGLDHSFLQTFCIFMPECGECLTAGEFRGRLNPRKTGSQTFSFCYLMEYSFNINEILFRK